MEGSITIASCFEPGTVVKLFKAADPGDMRPDASSIYVDKRTVGPDEMVGFIGDHLTVGELYFASGLFRGKPNVVRCRPEPAHIGSGELAQPVVTLQQPAIAIGTQEEPRKPDYPVAAPGHIGVGIQQPGEALSPEFLDEPAPDAGAAVESEVAPVPEPELAPSVEVAGAMTTTTLPAPGVVTETIPAAQTTPAPEPTPAPEVAPPSETAPQPEPPAAADPSTAAPSPAESPAPAEEAPAVAPESPGPQGLPALINQAVALGTADNAASMTVEELRQAIRDHGAEPVA